MRLSPRSPHISKSYVLKRINHTYFTVLYVATQFPKGLVIPEVFIIRRHSDENFNRRFWVFYPNSYGFPGMKNSKEIRMVMEIYLHTLGNIEHGLGYT